MFSVNPLPSLPKYPGPHNVGSTEYEIPVSEIDPKSSPPDPRITTIKLRLYYPTDATSSKEAITWIPHPQKAYINAFSSFLGAAQGWSSFITPILSVMNCITVPALANTPLRKQKTGSYPLAIFSHGLAGNSTMYSALCGSLASCGIICAAPEHRDGSVPISWIRGPGGKIASEIPYWKLNHDPTIETFDGRNAQMRVRLWELGLLYSALDKMNEGQHLTNYASSTPGSSDFKSSIDFAPGHVSWLGHSFGAATVTQFIKSIYYHHALPSTSSSTQEADKPVPLYTPASSSSLSRQITPDSPIALLDVFTLPFRSPSTRWLWEKPLPCYDRSTSSSSPSTVAIMSNEFYRYTNMRKRTHALLSPDPAAAEKTLINESTSAGKPDLAPQSPLIPGAVSKPDETQLEFDIMPAPAMNTDTNANTEPLSSPSTREASPSSPQSSSPTPSAHSSSTSLSTPPPASSPSKTLLPESKTNPAPKLFYIPSSAHLSQSDFGLLFPTLTKYMMKAINPQETIEINVRAILGVMRSAGLDVKRIDLPKQQQAGWFGGWRSKQTEKEGEETHKKEEEEDMILSGDKDVPGTNGRWIELPLAA